MKKMTVISMVTAAAKKLQQQLIDLEMNLVDLRLTGGGQDGVRFGSKLISKLGYLANGVSTADFRPTDQHEEVRGILNTELKRHLTALEGIIGKDLAALQRPPKGTPAPRPAAAAGR